MSRIAVLIIVLAVSRAGAEQSLASAYGGAAAIAPLGMANKWVGGAASLEGARLMDFIGRRDPATQQIAWNWESAGGPRTVGLLARIWGSVTSVYASPVTGEKWFYVDDGSRCVSDLGDVGVLVYSDAEVKEGQIVAVTGEAGVEQSFDSTGRLVRTMRPGSAGDVVVLKEAPPPPEYPFSDEFDGPKLDPRWSVIGRGQFSLTQEPGWLLLSAGPGTSQLRMCQGVPGDWDAEAKVRLTGTAGSSPAYAGFLVGYTQYAATLSMYQTGGIVSYNVVVHGEMVANAQGDTCWFRLRRRGTDLSVSYSFDGAVFSAEATKTVSWLPYVPLGVASGTSAQATAYFDYIRFTRVME